MQWDRTGRAGALCLARAFCHPVQVPSVEDGDAVTASRQVTGAARGAVQEVAVEHAAVADPQGGATAATRALQAVNAKLHDTMRFVLGVDEPLPVTPSREELLRATERIQRPGRAEYVENVLTAVRAERNRRRSLVRSVVVLVVGLGASITVVLPGPFTIPWFVAGGLFLAHSRQAQRPLDDPRLALAKVVELLPAQPPVLTAGSGGADAPWELVFRYMRQAELGALFCRVAPIRTRWARRVLEAQMVMASRAIGDLELEVRSGQRSPSQAREDCLDLLCRLALTAWDPVPADQVGALRAERGHVRYVRRMLATFPSRAAAAAGCAAAVWALMPLATVLRRGLG